MEDMTMMELTDQFEDRDNVDREDVVTYNPTSNATYCDITGHCSIHCPHYPCE